MTLRILESFRVGYSCLPKHIQRQVDKALKLLQENPHHPSLYGEHSRTMHTKKIKGTRDVWEARVTLAYRLTFNWQSDLVILRRVGAHDILKKEKK